MDTTLSEKARRTMDVATEAMREARLKIEALERELALAEIRIEELTSELRRRGLSSVEAG